MPSGHIVIEPDQTPGILLQLHQGNGIHLGLTKLLTTFNEMYWSLNIDQVTKKVIQACLPSVLCARGKDTIHNLNPIRKHQAHLPWQVLTFDVMGLLTTYQGYQYFVTFVNTYIICHRPGLLIKETRKGLPAHYTPSYQATTGG